MNRDEPTVSQAIPEHELVRPIASGAYGEVWLARSALGTWRAVKIVRRDRFERGEEFEREFRGLQRFEPISRTQEALVDVLQIGRQEHWFYYVMELADDAGANSTSVILDPKKIGNPKSEVEEPGAGVEPTKPVATSSGTAGDLRPSAISGKDLLATARNQHRVRPVPERARGPLRPGQRYQLGNAPN